MGNQIVKLQERSILLPEGSISLMAVVVLSIQILSKSDLYAPTACSDFTVSVTHSSMLLNFNPSISLDLLLS